MKLLITESHKQKIQEGIIIEGILDGKNVNEIIQNVLNYAKKGILTTATLAMVISYCNLSDEVAEQLKKEVSKIEQTKDINQGVDNTWKLASKNVIGTVYNAVPEQCDDDCGVTASGFRLNLFDVFSHRIIAMERTFMKKLGLEFGDLVKIEGTGKYDGVFQVQDLMNKRFSGMKKIDLLLPKEVKYGQWDDLTLYTLNDKSKHDLYKSKFADQISKSRLSQQIKKLKR